jgi:hypothetical protein
VIPLAGSRRDDHRFLDAVSAAGDVEDRVAVVACSSSSMPLTR